LVGHDSIPGAWYSRRCSESSTKTNPNIPVLIINGKSVIAIQEELNAFADTLEHIFTKNSDV
jgi:hypothetical protein